MFFTSKIVGLMAATPSGIIGCKGKLPWHEPEELAHFHTTLKDHPILMGRKTYEGLPKSLCTPRRTIVLSRQTDFAPQDVHVTRSLPASLRHIKTNHAHKTIFMIGGADIAHLFLQNSLINCFIFTIIHKEYTGDARLNLKHFASWHKSILKQHPNFTVYKLVQRA